MKIRICSVEYEVKGIKPAPDDDFVGRCHPHKLLIEMDTRLPAGRRKQTLFHEIFHAIGVEYNLKLSERHADVLSGAILALFKNNPKLKDML